MPTPRPRPPHQDQNRPDSASSTTISTAPGQPLYSTPIETTAVTRPNQPHFHSAVASPLNSPAASSVDRFTTSGNQRDHVTDSNSKPNALQSNAPLGLYRNVGDDAAGSLTTSKSQAHKIALVQARLFSQQLIKQQQQHQQQQQLRYQRHPPQQQTPIEPRSSFSGGLRGVGIGEPDFGEGERPAVGSVMSGRPGSIAASSLGGSSPVLGSVAVEGRTEQTLLLVRPPWVQDQDASACHICARTFNTMRRKHHCRQCGNVLCHDCSAQSIALPQLGYTKAVRVCSNCFEVAYLVAYCLSDDLGPSTQIHGARGLYELVESNKVSILENVVDNGGVDALIYLCNKIHGFELHALATSSLAILAEHESIQSVIMAKDAMPVLFGLVGIYALQAMTAVRPPSPPPMSLLRMASTMSLHSKTSRRVETVVVVLMNITHIVYHLVYNLELSKQLVRDGALDSLMSLSVYFPAEVRTRATERAIRSMALAKENHGLENRIASGNDEVMTTASSSHTPSIEESEEHSVLAMDEVFHVRLENMQGIAAKCISVLASNVSSQTFLVDDPGRIDRLVQLLYSNNPDVVKYASKTMAYLSLRNDRFKPNLVRGSGAAALLSVIWSGAGASPDDDDSLSAGTALSEAVSHSCCALANLATNTESQEILMAHLDLLNAACSVVGRFPHQQEIERHVARLIANLALYEQNKLSLLTGTGSPSENIRSEQDQSPRPQPATLPHRHSSPLPRRAKGNVIPTLLYIGALTLERADGVHLDASGDVSQPLHDQDTLDFMNDGRNVTESSDAGYLTPSESASEKDQESTTEESQEPLEMETLEWMTVPGMEDVQRHIIRAIDNLITVVMEDPESDQSSKVFSKIWPTLGLIKTIQMTNQDEDTQRRASHVLGTLIQQQQIHGDTLTTSQPQPQPNSQLSAKTALAEAETTHAMEQEPAAARGSLKAKAQGKHAPETLEDSVSEVENKERIEKEALEAKLLLEKEEQEAERVKIERQELERLEAARLKKERKEAKRLEAARLEEERKEEERQETERLEEERKEAERLEAERLENEQKEAKRLRAARRKEERKEAERLEEKRKEEEDRLEAERLEKERKEEEDRLEAERLEKERKEEEDRLEAERLEKERKEKKRLEAARLKEERKEAERLEAERLEIERLEKERLEAARLEAERLEKERLEAERLEAERLEAERLEKERLEAERLEAERLEAERLEAERLEAERLEKERLEAVRLEEEHQKAERLETARSEEEKRQESERLESEGLKKERQEPERMVKRLQDADLERHRKNLERLAARTEQKRVEPELQDKVPHGSTRVKKEQEKYNRETEQDPAGQESQEELDQAQDDQSKKITESASKVAQSSEELSTSQDEETKEKAKKKKKKKSGK